MCIERGGKDPFLSSGCDYVATSETIWRWWDVKERDARTSWGALERARTSDRSSRLCFLLLQAARKLNSPRCHFTLCASFPAHRCDWLVSSFTSHHLCLGFWPWLFAAHTHYHTAFTLPQTPRAAQGHNILHGSSQTDVTASIFGFKRRCKAASRGIVSVNLRRKGLCE